MNDPVMLTFIQAKLFASSYTTRQSSCSYLNNFTTKYRSFKLNLIYIFGHVLTVNSRSLLWPYKNFIPLRTFFKFHSHLEANSARSFQNVFDKCSRVLNLVFSQNGIFLEHCHILGYIQP